MVERNITWTVSDDGLSLTPTTPQYGGVQGEDNAAAVFFNIGENCPLANPDYHLYIEAVDATGAWDRTDILMLNDGYVSALVPRAWTQNGGTTTLNLVAESGDTVVFALEGKLYFTNRQTAETAAQGVFRSEIQKALAEIREAHRKITVMAAEAGFVEEYADHIKEINAGKATYLWTGTKEEFKQQSAYLPEGTVALFSDDDTVDRLEKLIADRAPGDIGLGKAVKITDNSIIDTLCSPGGQYCFEKLTVDGHTFSYAWMHVSGYADGTQHAQQTLHPVGSPSYTLTRTKYMGEWKPWEWENPPMEKGVKYRLPERFKKAVVYTELCEISTDAAELNADGTSYTMKGTLELHPTDGYTAIIVRYTPISNSRLLPRVTTSATSTHSFNLRRDGSYVYYGGSDGKDTTITVQVWYYEKEES